MTIRVAVSTVIFALHPGDGALVTPLVRRTRDPYRGDWALPGGWADAEEGLETTAARKLRETTQVEPAHLEQLYTFGEPGRSPTGRVVSVVYWALVRRDQVVDTGDPNVRWFPADDPPALAFDHRDILGTALWRLRNKLEYSRIAHAFLGDTFTLSELRQVHEVVLQRRLDPANFRRQVEASGEIVPTGERVTGSRHRPPRLYRYAAAGAPRGPAPPRKD